MPKSKHRKKHKNKLEARKKRLKKSDGLSRNALRTGAMSLIAGAILNG